MLSRRIRKLANRSGLELCSLCNEPHRLVEHHIRGRDILDFNHKDNLCCICDNCHRKVHENIINIDGWYMTTDGRQLIWEYNVTNS